MAMNRREFLKRAGFGGAAAVAAQATSRGKAQERKPNIVFVLADDLGYGDLGCYGQETIQTPVLDRFASEGLKFTDVYAGSTVCAPSRCCLMTGKHTGHAWVRGNARIPLRPEDRTVAETLKNAGYTTGIVGKWGLGEPDTSGVPNRQGFDDWFGFLNQGHAHNYYPEYLWRNEERVELEGNKDGGKGQYAHDLFTDEALQFVRRHADEPFFLYLAYTIPHANNELGRESGNGMEVPSDEPYSNESWSQIEKNTAAMITRMDRDIGRLLDLLRELGLDENTLVFFTSDNGPHKEGGHDADFFDSRGPLRGIKRDLYEGGIRVPTMARWPGTIEAGSVSDFPWAFWDFLPTAAAIAGAEAGDTDGVSILPTLLGQPQPERDYLYWEFFERGFDQAVRMGDWKGVKRKRGAWKIELYNLSVDIGEQNDVADVNPTVVARIDEIMRSARADNRNYQAPVEAFG